MTQRCCIDSVKRSMYLIGNIVHRKAFFTLFKALPYTDDRDDTFVQKSFCFFIDKKIRLSMILAAFGMPDNAVLGSNIGELIGGNLTGISSLFIFRYILSACGNFCLFSGFYHNRDHYSRCTKNNITRVGLWESCFQLFHKRFYAGSQHIHLPVAGNDSLTIFTIHVFLLSVAILVIYPKGRQHREVPYLPGIQVRRLRRWRYALPFPQIQVFQ